MLLRIARDPRIRIREIAALLEIPERAAQRIVTDLTRTGYIDSERQGRRNVYGVRSDRSFNFPFQRDITSMLYWAYSPTSAMQKSQPPTNAPRPGRS